MNLNFTKFEIDIDGVEYPNSFQEDIKVDRTDLDSEFAAFSEKYAYYAMLHELSKDNERKLKRELEILEAILDNQKRMEAQQAMGANPKLKYTEKMYSAEVKTDKAYQEKEIEYLNSRKMAGLLGAAREAIAFKKDMLISMGANARVGVSELKMNQVRDILSKSGSIRKQVEE